MPRAPVAGREIRRRSRNGCWNCKARKVKCGEEKPRCANCTRLDEDCDYKIRLSWGGRPLKKKLLEQGAQIDDPSQNIPGAGQFSINQFNPAPTHSHSRHSTPSSFPSTPTTPSSSRPSAGVKKSSKQQSKPGMPVYQNVFPVCGVTPQAMLPVSTMPNSQQYCVAPAFPQQSLYPGLWTSEGEAQQPLTPLSTMASENQFPIKEESFAHYTNGNGSFMPQMASPTPSLATLAMTSPTSATNSSMPSPQQSFTDHVILNQHNAVGSPSGHMKASASPEVQYRIMPHETTAAMSAGLVVPSSGPLCNSMDYMGGPLTPPTEGHPYKGDARRLSVQNLLAAPVPSNHHGFSQYGPNIVPSSHFSGENMPAIDPSLEDAEVEEIPRYDQHGNLVQKKSQSQQPFLGVSGPLGSVNAHSVYLSIPRSLHPLPAMLMDNVESAMYFHHFLTHTASLLVPHDCGRNPFKTILPQMAMQTDSLLNLLLAYSASHQSRLLKGPEPTARISGFLGETVRSLTESLNDPVAQKSDATLTTAIMLCSYEIISPNSFAEGITWQTHLNAVRRIILARGGAEQMHSRDEISYFLSRWFAYLDVLGSLSGKDTQIPLFKGDYWILDDDDEMKDFSVDCFFGTTNRFVSLLARVGDLARKCDDHKRQYVDRMGSMGYSSTDSEWMPDGNMYQDAVKLKNEIEESRHLAMGSCNHKSHDDDDEDFRHIFDHSNHDRDQVELLATNEAYHLAAQIHLARRVFNLPTQHEEVQEAVKSIITELHKVSEEGTAINCWLFPMFIAGCESIDVDDRDLIFQRMLVMERNGLTQIQKARFLMEKVWASGSPWESMANGEFIG